MPVAGPSPPQLHGTGSETSSAGPSAEDAANCIYKNGLCQHVHVLVLLQGWSFRGLQLMQPLRGLLLDTA